MELVLAVVQPVSGVLASALPLVLAMELGMGPVLASALALAVAFNWVWASAVVWHP